MYFRIHILELGNYLTMSMLHEKAIDITLIPNKLWENIYKIFLDERKFWEINAQQENIDIDGTTAVYKEGILQWVTIIIYY